MSDLLREFEQDVRRERLDQLWAKFGKLMVAASLAVVLATVGVVVWKDRTQANTMKETSRFIVALERFGANGDAALEEFTADTGSTFYGPAMLRKAQAEQQRGDALAAKKTYETLAAQDSLYGELAKLHVSDELPKKDAVFYYARSEQAAWRLLEQGKKDEAVAIMNALAEDQDTPRSQRQRLMQVAAHLAPGNKAGQ